MHSDNVITRRDRDLEAGLTSSRLWGVQIISQSQY